ncbi:MAG: hypothetical protein KAS66_05195 [Candidatus Omnitrophica bacterium]|nr:hypothetical protein [Candidatus Omnitrophota bacterium]
MFSWFKKKKENEWICVNEFWGCDKYVESLVHHPDNSRMVDLHVVNGNVHHGMTGFYYDGEWYTDDYLPGWGVHFRKAKVTIVAWRELKKEQTK